MVILTLNIGSSSIKYAVYQQQNKQLKQQQTGQISGIGSPLASWQELDTPIELQQHNDLSNHQQAMTLLADHLAKSWQPMIVAHRIVHGGPMLTQPCVIDQQVLATIFDTIPLAPLHNPGQIQGVQFAQQYFPQACHVAVFDTSFHHTIPAHIKTYALPKKLSQQHHIQKYGFHGTSYQYILHQAQLFFANKTPNLIVCHLGNGASICAIKHGQSYDTSMGFTPCSGLVMGSRSGDIDPGVACFLNQQLGYDVATTDEMLNHQSGLVGLCGYHDMRQIEQQAADGDRDCQLALEVFCYRCQFYIGGFLASLGHIDGLIFTGGIGENSSFIRAKICASLSQFQLKVNPDRNKQRASKAPLEIQQQHSTPILVIQTDEEYELALSALKAAQAAS